MMSFDPRGNGHIACVVGPTSESHDRDHLNRELFLMDPKQSQSLLLASFPMTPNDRCDVLKYSRDGWRSHDLMTPDAMSTTSQPKHILTGMVQRQRMDDLCAWTLGDVEEREKGSTNAIKPSFVPTASNDASSTQQRAVTA